MIGIKKNCNGDWEHFYGIKIETIDNPGWSLTVDIQNLANKKIKNISWNFSEESDTNWYGYKIENGKFEASGDPYKLNYLIKLFRDIVESKENV